jgi:branched-chain amino acid transport system permease protein
VGGLVIGLAQSLAAGYQPEYASWLGSGFDLALPYIIMILVLLVRPYGFFGQREVRRV